MQIEPLSDLIAEGYAALEAGEWERARGCFRAALEERESAEALDGMGRALWWLKEMQASIHHRERAYADFRRRGDAHAAARTALWLSREYADALGNRAASNGWFMRAERLLEDVALCPEHGWLASFKDGSKRRSSYWRGTRTSPRPCVRRWLCTWHVASSRRHPYSLADA